MASGLTVEGARARLDAFLAATFACLAIAGGLLWAVRDIEGADPLLSEFMGEMPDTLEGASTELDLTLADRTALQIDRARYEQQSLAVGLALGFAIAAGGCNAAAIGSAIAMSRARRRQPDLDSLRAMLDEAVSRVQAQATALGREAAEHEAAVERLQAEAGDLRALLTLDAEQVAAISRQLSPGARLSIGLALLGAVLSVAGIVLAVVLA